VENQRVRSLANAGICAPIPIHNKLGFSKMYLETPLRFWAFFRKQKRFPSNEVAILNTKSQSIIKTVFLYKIGVEREQIVAIKLKHNIFSFLLLPAPGFEPLNLAGQNGLPLPSAMSWETSSCISDGAQQPDSRVGCPRRPTGSRRWAGWFMLGAGGTSFPPHGKQQGNAGVQAAAALHPGTPIDRSLCLLTPRTATPARRLRSIRQDSPIKANKTLRF